MTFSNLRKYTLLFMTLAAFAHGDGIPVDRKTGAITTSHTVLSLNDDQIEEMDVLRTVTLTSAQWRDIRKIVPSCPKRFDYVVPTSYDLCTCELTNYCIAISGKEIAILHDDHDSYFAYEDPHRSLFLELDRYGNFYDEGIKLDLEGVLTRIEEPRSSLLDEKESRSLYIHLPLYMERDNPIYKEKLNVIYKKATAA